jgi:NRPS condensation-like uncharacterized protein
MKVDCGYTENYLKELKRMCEENGSYCLKCGFYLNKNENITCRIFQMNHPDKAIKIVQEWSNENPKETRAEHFLKMHPNARRHNNGYPSACVNDLNKEVSCEECLNGCKECWNKPYMIGEF